MQVTPDSTCLVHLGQRDRDRIISIFVASLKVKVAKSSTVIAADGVIILVFANGNTA
jgi:hypothetical protein